MTITNEAKAWKEAQQKALAAADEGIAKAKKALAAAEEKRAETAAAWRTAFEPYKRADQDLAQLEHKLKTANPEDRETFVRLSGEIRPERQRVAALKARVVAAKMAAKEADAEVNRARHLLDRAYNAANQERFQAELRQEEQTASQEGLSQWSKAFTEPSRIKIR
jgi:phage I-like protein